MHSNFTLHRTPYTLHLTTYNLHPTPYTLHPTPYTLHPTPYTLHPERSTATRDQNEGGAAPQMPAPAFPSSRGPRLHSALSIIIKSERERGGGCSEKEEEREGGRMGEGARGVPRTDFATRKIKGIGFRVEGGWRVV